MELIKTFCPWEWSQWSFQCGIWHGASPRHQWSTVHRSTNVVAMSKMAPLMVCTLLGIYLASSHWLPCKGADSLHPAWQPVTGSIKLQVPDPHVQCHGGSYESFGDGELNGSPPCLGWPSQVTGWATPLPPYLPLWGKPCFQPSGTGWKKGSFQWAWILWHKVFPMAGGSKECSGILSLAWVWSHGCGWKLVGGAHMFYWETITTCIHGKHLPQGLFTMIWCMCDLCQKVFVGLWCYPHTIDKISRWCKFPIAAVMMGWVSVCMFKAWNGCGW